MENNNKAKWINSILSKLDNIDNLQSISIVESCGRECLNSSDVPDKIDGIRKCVEDKNDIDLLFKTYKEKVYQNSPRLYKENDTIYLIYDECGCGMVKEGGVTNPFLCNCTRGYTKAIFERLFDRTVDVNLKKSILRGDSKCEQEIVLN